MRRKTPPSYGPCRPSPDDDTPLSLTCRRRFATIRRPIPPGVRRDERFAEEIKMSALNPSPSPGHSQLVWRAAVVIAVVAYGFVFAREPERSDWYRCFFRAAERMQAGETIHIVEDRPYAYPPIMALMSVPLVKLGVSGGIVAWYLVNVAALVVLWRTSWSLLDAPPLQAFGTARDPAANRRWWGVAIVGGLLMSRFFFSALETRQFDLVIAAILTTGCLALRNGCETRGALWLGLAAGMKCTPLLFAPYLAWRGRWRAAAVLVVAALTVNLLPEVVYPQRDGGWYAADWNETFLSAAGRVPPGTWFSGLLQNQSLAGQLQRFARYGLPTSTAALVGTKLDPQLVPTLRVVLLIVSVGLLLVTAACGGRFGRSWSEADRLSRGYRQFAAEISAVFALMLLLSPMTSRAHYVVLLLPTWIVVREFVERRTVWTKSLVLALFLLGPMVSKGVVGRTGGELALAWGFPVAYAAVCLAAMWARLLRDRAVDWGGEVEGLADFVRQLVNRMAHRGVGA
jgi:hypothetical protein